MRIAAGLVLITATAASADPGFDPQAHTWYGADFEVLPAGSLHQTAGFGQVADASADTAYALGAIIEQRAGSLLSFAFAPRLLWNIGPADAVTSASQGSSSPTGKELDLRARIAAAAPLGDRTRVFVYLAPGYSLGFESVAGSTSEVHPHGAIAGAGLGVAYALDRRMALTIDLGYQRGYQGYSDPTRGDISDRTSYWSVAIGIAGAREPAPVATPAPAIASP